MSAVDRSAALPQARVPLVLAVVALLAAAILPAAGVRAEPGALVEHLVISEVVTGGAGASDELIELYNPAPVALPLEGLELIYVTASGATVSGRASWSAGAPVVEPGGHLLVANEAGIYASIADALYASGMAATGGSVALRIQGASTAIDAVGWGTSVSTWREGVVVAAPAAGGSIERLPGGALGSTQDTDDNAMDFVERPLPEPQNLGSPPTPEPGDPGPVATPTPAPSASPTPEPTLAASPSVTAVPTVAPGPTPITIAAARAAPDGTLVTVQGVTLTVGDFHDGGGFVVDPTAGVAVLVEDGSFERGVLLRVSGTVDDRFSQRTIRANLADVVVLDTGLEPDPETTSTGLVGEVHEGRLVGVAGFVDGSPTTLTTGVAFDLDNGSGAARVVVSTAAAIDVGAWVPGMRVDLVGVVSQRDSSGSGLAGYRVMPRNTSDIVSVTNVPASPGASASASPTASADPEVPEGMVSIGEARLAAKNVRVRVRGVVTLAPGIVDPATAVIQDGTGAIVLRLGDEAGDMAAGDRIEVSGARSTKSGMETLRVTEPHAPLGTATEPAPRELRTGDAGEAHEAHLVVARGALVASARRAGSGSVSFDIDDGSGPLRVATAAVLELDDEPLAAGTWVEVRGILGQETTGAQATRGYRIWPRSTADLRIVATATDGETHLAEGDDDAVRVERTAVTLDGIGGSDLAGLRVGATLVVGPWVELGIGGLLWDGTRLVAIEAGSSAAVETIVAGRRAPLALELSGMRAAGTEALSGASLVTLGTEPGNVMVADAAPAPPLTTLPASGRGPLWVSLVGRLADDGANLIVGGRDVSVDHRCDEPSDPTAGIVGITGIAAGEPVRLIAPCGGIRAVPAVSRSGEARALAMVQPRDAARTGLAERRATGIDTRRAVAAGLALLGGLLLAAAAVGGRRLEPDPVEEGADEARAPGGDGEEKTHPPHLTLVRVPREHGP